MTMTCKLCGGSDLVSVIDLGLMPLVNNLIETPEAPVPKCPLEMVRCRDCTLAQLTVSPPPATMYDQYPYFTSQSDTMLAHARALVRRYVNPGHRVIEIASNDGYLLSPAQSRGAIVLGVEPAANIAKYANTCGVPTLNAYFTASVARSIRAEFGASDIVFANNILAHVPDLHDFVEGFRNLIGSRGVIHVEVPWLLPMLKRGAFDTIYHEHQYYFSATALRHLFADHGFFVTSVEQLPIHGGSLHLTVEREGPTDAIDQLCAYELEMSIGDGQQFHAFRDRLALTRSHITEVLRTNAVVAGYGAAAKAVVMLNVFALDRSSIPWIADISPHKIGKFIPGTSQPIVTPNKLCRETPDACLLFAWNLREEIERRNQDYLLRGGRFISSLHEQAALLPEPALT